MEPAVAEDIERMRATLASISYIASSALMDLAALHDTEDLDHPARETAGLELVAALVDSIFPTSAADALEPVRAAFDDAVAAITTSTTDVVAAATEVSARVRAAWVVLELLPAHDTVGERPST